MSEHTIALLAGARPNFMKVFPVWRSLRDQCAGVTPLVIHTGQHYDQKMSTVFFEELGMPEPDIYLGVGSASHAVQTATVMMKIEPVLEDLKPNCLVVVGDVNSTVAGTLVAVKMGIPVAHVEAGLRSFDRRMPEEHNRIATDALSDLLLTSCRDADANLRREGVPEERIRFVGNVMIDSLIHALERARKSDIRERLKLAEDSYACVTLHRPSNVDVPEHLEDLILGLADVSEYLKVVFPVHPRTKAKIDSMVLPDAVQKMRDQGRLNLVEPLGYLDFLCLVEKASLVITDSGGIQEETSFLNIPCLTVRENTERPITITEGTNRLVRPDRSSIGQSAREALSAAPNHESNIELWDGRAGERIARILCDEFVNI